MRDDLRPRFDEVRKPLFQRLGDALMQGLARAAAIECSRMRSLIMVTRS
jgi:hypothetical protein